MLAAVVSIRLCGLNLDLGSSSLAVEIKSARRSVGERGTNRKRRCSGTPPQLMRASKSEWVLAASQKALQKKKDEHVFRDLFVHLCITFIDGSLALEAGKLFVDHMYLCMVSWRGREGGHEAILNL